MNRIFVSGENHTRRYVAPAMNWPDQDIASMMEIRLQRRNGKGKAYLEDQIMARVVFVQKQRGSVEQRFRYRREIITIRGMV